MTDPVGLDELSVVESWSCKLEEEKVEPPCLSPNQCALSHLENEINVIKYMTTCKVGSSILLQGKPWSLLDWNIVVLPNYISVPMK